MLLAAATCMALAAALRFPALTAQSLWIDEIYSAEMAHWPLATVLAATDGHPPLYALLLKAILVWSPSDVSGRVVSALAGVGAVGLMLWVGTLLFDLRCGVVAAALLAVSPLHVWYSREGRMYALVVLFGVASSLAFVAALRRGGWRAWSAYAAASAGGLLTHYLYAGLVVAQGVALVRPRARPTVESRHLLAAAGAIAVLGAFVLPVLLGDLRLIGAQRGFEWLALPYTGFTFLAGFGIGPPVEELHRNRTLAALAGYWPELALVAALGVAVTVTGLRALRGSGGSGLYLLLWLCLPPALAFAGSAIGGRAYNVRYAIVALPAFVLLAALAVTRSGRATSAALLAGVLVVSGMSIARDRLDPRYAREDLRAAATYLDAHAGATDRIVVCARYMAWGIAHYARQARSRIEELPARSIRSAEDAARAARSLRDAAPLWLVLTRDWEDDPDGLLRRELARGLEPVARFPGVRIYRLGS